MTFYLRNEKIESNRKRKPCESCKKEFKKGDNHLVLEVINKFNNFTTYRFCNRKCFDKYISNKIKGGK